MPRRSESRDTPWLKLGVDQAALGLDGRPTVPTTTTTEVVSCAHARTTLTVGGAFRACLDCGAVLEREVDL